MSIATTGRSSRWPSHPYRLSVAQYDAMARLGVLTKQDRVELFDGILVERRPKSQRQHATRWMIVHSLSFTLPQGWFAVTNWPVVLTRSEPEPDVMVIRGSIDDYGRRKPGPGDVALVVEVSDSTYADDLNRRAYYAESGITVYWIANIRERRIEVYSDPTGPGETPEYRTRLDHGWDDSVPLIVDGQVAARFAVRDLLPPFP
jgi:Uma2 family endonuclease